MQSGCLSGRQPCVDTIRRIRQPPWPFAARPNVHQENCHVALAKITRRILAVPPSERLVYGQAPAGDRRAPRSAGAARPGGHTHRGVHAIHLAGQRRITINCALHFEGFHTSNRAPTIATWSIASPATRSCRIPSLKLYAWRPWPTVATLPRPGGRQLVPMRYMKSGPPLQGGPVSILCTVLFERYARLASLRGQGRRALSAHGGVFSQRSSFTVRNHCFAHAQRRAGLLLTYPGARTEVPRSAKPCRGKRSGDSRGCPGVRLQAAAARFRQHDTAMLPRGAPGWSYSSTAGSAR